MKRNVDLTKDKVFSRWGIRPSIPSFKSVQKFPWGYSSQLSCEDNQLFFTGYVKDIKYRKELSNYLEGLACQRCGRLLSRGPWNQYYGLCKNCDEVVESEFISKKWKFTSLDTYTEVIHNTSDRVILELNYRRQ